MYTLLLIFSFIAIATSIVAVGLDQKRRIQQRKKIFLPIWIGFVFVCAIITIALPLHQQDVITENAKLVATYSDARLYHNTTEDTYFTIHYSPWDPIHLFKQRNVDNKIAEKAVENVRLEREYATKNAYFYDENE